MFIGLNRPKDHLIVELGVPYCLTHCPTVVYHCIKISSDPFLGLHVLSLPVDGPLYLGCQPKKYMFYQIINDIYHLKTDVLRFLMVLTLSNYLDWLQRYLILTLNMLKRHLNQKTITSEIIQIHKYFSNLSD